MPWIVESNRERPGNGDGRAAVEGEGETVTVGSAPGPVPGDRKSISPTRPIAAIVTAVSATWAELNMNGTTAGRPSSVLRCGLLSTAARTRFRTQPGARCGASAA